jgi:hypothetical protein
MLEILWMSFRLCWDFVGIELEIKIWKLFAMMRNESFFWEKFFKFDLTFNEKFETP